MKAGAQGNLSARMQAKKLLPKSEHVLQFFENEWDQRALREMNGSSCAAKQMRQFRRAERWRVSH